MMSRSTSLVASVVSARWHIAKLTPRAGWGLVTVTALLNLVLGLLPVVFLVATSVLLGRIPAAARAGFGSSAWEGLVSAIVVAGGAIVAQQVLTPMQTALGDLMARRVDGQLYERIMAASLSSPGLGALENPAVQDDLAEASRELEFGYQSPGRACAGLLALVARYVQLTGYAVAVGVAFSWIAAVGVFVATMLFRYGQRGGLRKYSAVFPRLAAVRRKSDYLRDLLTGVSAGKEIRVFGLIDWLRGLHHEAYTSWMLPVWAERRRIYLKPFAWLTAAGVLIVAALLAALGVSAAHSLSLTRFALVAQAVLAALRLGDHYPEADVQTQFGMNAYDAVRALERDITRHDQLTDAPSVQRLPKRAGSVRFTDVSFQYPGHQRTVLNGLQLTIPAGRCTALVGLNGAGKTTLVKLLTRLYDPTAGSITVDGVDLRSVAVDDWRRQLGVIFQDYLRYETTAADNVGFGCVEHLDDTAGIALACQSSGIAETLDALPAGPRTLLARQLTGGVDLSGGQWQRVAIARALFALRHGASILVLDEPTASLDVRAEARFYEQFVGLTEGVTTLLISHRFSTVRLADNIVVLEDGRVLEQGSHEELLRLDGRYAKLFRLQAMRFTGADGTGDAEDPHALEAST